MDYSYKDPQEILPPKEDTLILCPNCKKPTSRDIICNLGECENCDHLRADVI